MNLKSRFSPIPVATGSLHYTRGGGSTCRRPCHLCATQARTSATKSSESVHDGHAPPSLRHAQRLLSKCETTRTARRRRTTHSEAPGRPRLHPLRRRRSGADSAAQALPRTCRRTSRGWGRKCVRSAFPRLWRRASGRSGVVRGFPANCFFAGPAAAVLAPAFRPREDGGPEQRHRRRRLRGSLHRVLHLLRPQEAE